MDSKDRHLLAKLDADTRIAIVRAVGEWLDLKYKFESCVKHGNEHVAVSEADAAHSALLRRLLEGHEPLRKPPPRRYNYPDYRSEIADDQGVVGGMFPPGSLGYE